MLDFLTSFTPLRKQTTIENFLRKHWFLLSLLFILLITIATRFYRLGDVPSGMTWDEAAIGYNGHAIRVFRRDEWLNRLPVSFKSFGDYKAPLAIYISGAFTWIFGLNIFAVRLPFAIAGVFAVLGMMLLTYLLYEKFFSKSTEQLRLFASVVAGFIMATSPWHIHFSRAGFESGMSLTLLIWGVVFFLLSFRKVNSSLLRQTGFLSLSAISFVLSMYAYHSAKIVAPVIGILLVVTFFRHIIPLWKSLIIPVFVALFAIRPMIMDTFWGSGGERFTQTSVFAENQSLLENIQLIIHNFFTHLTPAFLIFGETTTLRHGDGKWGVLLITELILILLFIILLGVRKNSDKNSDSNPVRKSVLFALLWIVIGILPASIGESVPHSNRALLALPGFVLLSTIAMTFAVEWYGQLNTQAKSWWGMLWGKRMEFTDQSNIIRASIGMFFLIHSLLFVSYMHDYFTTFAKESSQDFYYGYEQAFEFAIDREDSVDKILFTSKYGQPHIYAIFFRKTHPQWYQGGSLIKYEFTDQISESDLHREKTVIIATPEEIDPSQADELVIAPNGEVKFVLIDTQ